MLPGVVGDGFGFLCNNPATTFDVFYWLKITANFGERRLLQSTPNGPDYIDIWALWLHGPIKALRAAPRNAAFGKKQAFFALAAVYPDGGWRLYAMEHGADSLKIALALVRL